MSSPLATERLTTALDALADPRRRHLLSILRERGEPVPVETLATDVAVGERGSPIVTDEQSRTVHVELVHNHVPRLLDIGLVIEDAAGDERRIGLADHPLLETDWVAALLDRPAGGSILDEATLNRTLEALRSARRRTACAELARRCEPLHVADLAATLVARADEDRRLVDVTESDRRPVETSLVHEHLPALADAGLVEYDAERGTAAIATDAPQWRAEWLTAGPLGELTAALESRDGRVGTDASAIGAGAADVVPSAAGACWTLEGRGAVVARGHQIADDADEELFVTMPEAEMIQRRCLERWRAATERGVDVYVGSCSPRVRDTVRATVPDATICEPQVDWLNFPLDGTNHGRVVFADRETVMLVTVDEGNPGDEPNATAITATGPENTLVRLVREHVGPRLDRLQSRADDDDGRNGQTAPHPL